MLRIVVLATSLTLEGSGLHICWNSSSGRKGSLPSSAWMTHVGMDLSTWLLLCRAICQYVTTSGYHPHCWCCRSLIKPESYQGEIACLKLQLCLNYSNWLHDELITESYYQVSVSNSLHFSNCHIVLGKNGCVRCSICIKQLFLYYYFKQYILCCKVVDTCLLLEKWGTPKTNTSYVVSSLRLRWSQSKAKLLKPHLGGTNIKHIRWCRTRIWIKDCFCTF